MKKILLFQLLLSFSLLNAFSQNGWKMYTMITDSVKQTMTICYIDTNYLAYDKYRNGKVWTRVEFDNPLKKNKNTLSDNLYAFNCAQKRVVLLQTIKRRPVDNSIIKVFKYNPSENDWQDVPPGSVGQLLLQNACELLVKAKE
jgi:hypothetical protein